MKTLHKLSTFDLHKLNEFFNPRENQIQWYCTSEHLANVLVDMGYSFTEESTGGIWYFVIPLRFRSIEKVISETKIINW